MPIFFGDSPSPVKVYLGDFLVTTALLNNIAISIGSAPVKSTTTTSLTSNKANPTSVDTVTLTASVAPSDVTGTVTFKDGTTTIGTGTLSNGVATLSGTFAAGSHNLTAVYSGDTKYGTSTSSVLSLTAITAPGALKLNDNTSYLLLAKGGRLLLANG